MAYLLGDRTAQNSGRLSFNPISHIDPIGLLCMIFFGFGWAKPVPVNPRYFKNPKTGMALTALAGPMSNFCMGIIAITAYAVISLTYPGRLLSALASFLYVLGSLNVGLGVFNLLPVPPLDGSKIMFMFLPDKWVVWFYQYDGYIRLVLLLSLYLGFMDGIIGWGQSALLNAFIDVALKFCSFLGLL